jgi:hypothetical protein
MPIRQPVRSTPLPPESIDSHERVGSRIFEPGCIGVPLPEWSTAASVVPGTAMIDRLIIGWSDVWQCGDQRSVALLMANLTNGRNLIGERVSRGYYWEAGPQLRLRLRCSGRADDFMTSTVSFERYASPAGTLRISGQIHINPTRLIAHLEGQSVEEWFRTGRTICPRRDVDPHDNFLRMDPSAPARAEYHWSDIAAQIADNFIGVVTAALHGDRSHRPPHIWLHQVEAYWEFATTVPISAVDGVAPAIRACARSTEGRYERLDDTGLPVLGLLLGSVSDSSRLALYPRDGRVRVEVRFLKNVARSAPGAGVGDLAHRLRNVAAAASRHVNGALRATRPHRHQNVLFGFGSLISLLQRIMAVLGVGSDRIRPFTEELLRNRYVRAGAERTCIISLNEAQRLQRAGVLVRRSARSRDLRGRIFALDAYFEGCALQPAQSPADSRLRVDTKMTTRVGGKNCSQAHFSTVQEPV